MSFLFVLEFHELIQHKYHTNCSNSNLNKQEEIRCTKFSMLFHKLRFWNKIIVEETKLNFEMAYKKVNKILLF